MAITSATLRAARELRVDVDSHVDDATRTLVKAWAGAWDELQAAWNEAAQELIDYQRATGAWPPAWRVDRFEQTGRALQATGVELTKLSKLTGVTVSHGIEAVVPLTVEQEAGIIATQMPRQAGTRAELTSQFNRVDPGQISQMVARTTQQVTALSWPLSSGATDAMKASLLRGVGTGDNPQKVARDMVKRVEGHFNGGLARAMTIARTEMLDAHRAAAKMQHDANADVLIGWTWQAQLDRRTCPSCWGQHGSIHTLDEEGPLDHQNGRCARLPKTKSWKELGFDIDEPHDLLPDAQKTFDALPREEQLAIMGPTRLDALDNGAKLADMSTLRKTSGWRDSYGPTPVSALPTGATT